MALAALALLAAGIILGFSIARAATWDRIDVTPEVEVPFGYCVTPCPAVDYGVSDGYLDTTPAILCLAPCREYVVKT